MSSIDKRIVQMQFDNQGFEKGVHTTMKSLENLNESLKMKNATNGLTGVQSGMNKLASIGMGALTHGVDTVSMKFNAMGIVATTALMNITNSAINTGKKIANALTIEPITTGFSEYETKMNAIQTILTNTASKGTTLDDVTAALNELNEYADKTIYNFAEMTKNIGTFTAAGVGLEDSVLAIKGISNLGAGSGSTPTQVATGMYQLSQALAAGKVSLQDWNSVVSAGMGGELFKNELISMAKSMGIYVNESKPFRETLQDGWLTSEVLLKTLQKFADDDSLTKAATEVKTFTGLIDTMKESVQSGWAVSWEHIIGNKEQATELFTSLSDGFTSLIQPSTDARNAMLEYWNAHGGRTAVINGLTNVLKYLGTGLKAIKSAWEEAFPSMTGEKLTVLSAKFEQFTKKLTMNYKTYSNIKKIFKGLFDGAILAKDGIVAVIQGLAPLGSNLASIISKIISSVATFGDKISELREKASEIGIFNLISSQLGKATSSISEFIFKIGDAISSLASKMFDIDLSGFIGGIGSVFSKLGNAIMPFFKQLSTTMGDLNLNSFFGLFIDLTKAQTFLSLAQSIKEMLSNKGSDNKGGFLESLKGLIESYAGIGESISDLLGGVKNALEDFQTGINIQSILKVSIAIGILAGSLLVMSSIDSDNLIKGLTGLGVLISEMCLAFAVLSKMSTDTKVMQIGTTLVTFALSILIIASALKTLSEIPTEKMTTGLIGLSLMLLLVGGAANKMIVASQYMKKPATGILVFSAALLVMTKAVKELSEIDSSKIITGLIGLGVLLAELSLFLKVTKFDSLGMKTSLGILVFAAALNVLANTVNSLGNMSPEAVILGLSAMAIMLSEIALFAQIIKTEHIIKIGIGLTVISGAVNLLTKALNSLGTMTWSEIARGLTALAGGLLGICVMSDLLSESKLISLGIGIGVISTSLLLLSAALQSMGGMSWTEIGKGLLALGVSLGILAISLESMKDTVTGAAALLVAAAALAVLTPQLLMLSQMDLVGMLIALAAMAGAFTIIGVAATVLAPVVPALLSFAGAIALIGLGAAACGAGLLLIGTGILMVGTAVAGSGMLILEFIKELVLLIPLIGTKLAEGFVNFGVTLASNAPIIVEALKTLLMVMLETIRTVIPELFIVATEIVIAFADAVKVAVPYLVEAGLQLVLGVLQGIADNIQQIVEAGADVIINFCNGLANKLPDVIQAAFDLAITFIEGLATAIDENHEKLNSAIEHLIIAMVTAFKDFITNRFPEFKAKAKELWDKFIEGCKEKIEDAKKAAKEILNNVKEAAMEKIDGLKEVGKNLIKGFIEGIKSMATGVIDSVTGVVQGAIDWAESLLGINSPSKVFKEIGQYVGEGFVIGIDSYSDKVGESAGELAESVIRNVKDPLSNISKLLNDDIDVNPTIRPVMDLSNIENGTRLLNDMLGNQQVRLNASSVRLAGTVGKIQNGTDNKDIIDALKDLKDGLSNNGPSYTINGITYDDGSNVVNAVETLVRAARIERRI